MRAIRPSVWILASAFAAGCWPPGPAAAADATALEPGVDHEGRLELSEAGGALFRLRVPPDAVALVLELECSLADLDLLAAPGAPDDWLDAPWRSESPLGDELLTLDSFSEPPLEAGELAVQVAWTYGRAPRVGSRRLDAAPFTLRARVFEPRLDGVLLPGEALEGVLAQESGGFRTFAVDVPPGAPALRLDLVEASTDLDLFARPGRNVLAVGDDTAFAQNPWGRESLVVLPGGDPPLVPGRWYVDVRDVVDPARAAEFTLLATLAAAPPAQLLELPVLAPPAGAREPLARALAAVAEVASPFDLGSATWVSADGWMLTNAHVVASDPQAELVLSASVDPRRPPRELFRGRVRRLDRERDLALVEVVSGLHGQPLPEGYRFPTVELGDPDALAIGDPLYLVGYPTTGGSATRVSISVTRGIVAGFEHTPHGTWIKTDAEITSGNSGGAALDAQGRLVGVPTSTIEHGSGQLGYVQPLSALPADWRALLERAR